MSPAFRRYARCRDAVGCGTFNTVTTSPTQSSPALSRCRRRSRVGSEKARNIRSGAETIFACENLVQTAQYCQPSAADGSAQVFATRSTYSRAVQPRAVLYARSYGVVITDSVALLIGSTSIMQALRPTIERIAATEFTILIEGSIGRQSKSCDFARKS